MVFSARVVPEDFSFVDTGDAWQEGGAEGVAEGGAAGCRDVECGTQAEGALGTHHPRWAFSGGGAARRWQAGPVTLVGKRDQWP